MRSRATASGKAGEAFRTISEAAAEVGVAPHVLRFWESRFPFLRPLRRAGGRRYYRAADIALLITLRRLLHEEGRSIESVRAQPPQTWRPDPGRRILRKPPRADPRDRALAAALRRAEEVKARLDRLLASCGV